MKQLYYLICLLFIIFLSPSLFGQTTNRVLVTVNWPIESFEHKVEIYDPANNLLLSFCNIDDCYNTNGDSTIYTATYDLGCLATETIVSLNYAVVLYDAGDNGWGSNSSVTVNVGGTDVFTNSGSNAGLAGDAHPFDVNSTNLCTLIDTDLDGVIDVVDQDDDNDGVLDVAESLGLDQFNCTVPSLNFVGNGNIAESGIAGQVGAIYRFQNVVEGYDVLVEILAIDNTELVNIDDDTVDVVNSLQTKLIFDGTGTPGVEFEFSLVDTGTSNLAATIFRIGGTTWDCDGTETLQESLRYYDPSAYGLDNPTSLTIDDYVDGAGITAGTNTYLGYSTNTVLRSYFQFQSNTFKIRMQAKKTSSEAALRLYAMSFTQCDIFDYKAPILIITSGVDTDGDKLDNQLDLDSDNDGIPDNVEAQPTNSYVSPNGVFDVITGIDTAYSIARVLEDTDGDEILDMYDLDSDNDTTPDIQENGMANSIAIFTDADGDGLDDLFETNGINDPVWDVNEDLEDPTDLSILPDTDGDLGLGGDLDYRDAIDVFIESASVDFDGIDDHIAETAFMSGWPDATLMAWVKLDPTFSSDGDVAGQGLMRMYVNGSTKKLHSYYITSFGSSAYGASSLTTLDTDQWHHVAISYEGASGNIKLYVNGQLESLGSIPAGTLSTDPIYADPDFNIGRHSKLDNSYFKGAIDEVRVFNAVLTEDQLQQMVYQEIEQDGAIVKGSVLNKGIMNVATTATVPWVNLQAYYPMTNILTGKTTDASSYGRDGTLKNIFTVQPQTAPMPYETVADGPWATEGTWLHGDVWDIEDASMVKPWSIVEIKNNISTSDSHSQNGLKINAGSTLTVNGDKAITNNWYLELNGTLDLQDDSQLVQSIDSDLVTSATGNIIRRQEGNSNLYWYNYWSSPVGLPSITTLSDNNTSSNNENNSSFKLEMLKDGAGADIVFTSANEEEGMVSDKWLFSYLNGLTFWDWITLTPTSEIEPGMGYTQKGTGNPGEEEQQYIFQGKPNNGTILIQSDDVNGDGDNESEQDVTLTTTFVGNPYPSALDARQFIDDNDGVIGGAVYVWEQWSGTSHILEEYEGGYGTINNATTERAYQWNDPNPEPGGSPFAKKPTFYIPVAQGFFVEVVNDGNNAVLSADDDIEFNNGQRVFVKESDSDGVDPNNGSVFFRDGDPDTSDSGQNFGMIRLELKVSNGNNRSFVLAFSDDTTDGYDYGYDARTIDPQDDDLNSFLGDEKMIIQSYGPLTDNKVVDLVFNSTGNYEYTLEIVEIINLPDNRAIYLKDNLTNTYFDLRSGAYSFSSDVSNEDHERFDIVFQDETLSNEDVSLNDIKIYVNNANNKLYVKGSTEPIENLAITNMLGQIVKSYKSIDINSLENGLYIGELSSGIYMVNLSNINNLQLVQKIILN